MLVGVDLNVIAIIYLRSLQGFLVDDVKGQTHES